MTPAEIYSEHPVIDDFAFKLASLNGVFSFEAADMIALGDLYFKRCPDRVHGRNMDEVHAGYALARVCIIEKLVSGLPAKYHTAYRPVLAGRVLPAEGLQGISSSEIGAHYETLRAELENLNSIIEQIPKGMIKERFVGGISNIFNILYLLKMKIGNGAGQS